MKIAIGCDPNAENEKQALMKFIEDKGLGEVEDFGSTDPIYANVAIKVGEAVASKEFDRGILLCGTGLGVSIAANKVKGAYAALLTDAYSAERARLKVLYQEKQSRMMVRTRKSSLMKTMLSQLKL